jgi:hypothetical protein
MDTSPSSMNTSTGTDSILNSPIGKLSDGTPYVLFGSLVLVLTIIMIILAFANPTSLLNNKSVASPAIIKVLENIGLVLMFVTITTLVLLLYVPSMKMILQLVDKVKGALLLFVFLFGLIVFYRNVSASAIMSYRILIVPTIMMMAWKLFSGAMQPSTEEEYTPNLQIEKIRLSLVYVAFVTFVVIMYSVDFGGVLREYMGPSLTATITLLVMGLVYLLTLLSYPIIKPKIGETGTGGLLSGFTSFGIGHTVFFVVSILLMFTGVFINMSDFTDNDGVLSFKNTRASQLFGVSITLLILWVGFFSVRMFSDVERILGKDGNTQMQKITSVFHTILLTLGGLGFISTLIYWFVSMANSFNKTHSVGSLLLNLVVIFTIMIFMFKYLANTTHFQKSPYFRLVVNSLFYIPCLLYDFIRSGLGMLGIGVPSLRVLAGSTASGAVGLAGKVGSIEKPSGADMITLVVVLLVYASYLFIIPYSMNKFAKQGGNVILQEPVSLATVKTLGTYTKLNGIVDESDIPVISQVGVFNYTYAVSLWVYLDSTTASVSDNYYTVMNYNEMPHIMWNPKKGTMIFTVKNTKPDPSTNPDSVGDVAKNGNTVLLTLASVAMQKWNNIVVNYVNGTLDMFVNGKLIQSSRDIVPEMSYGDLTIGSPKLSGKVCNVVYFNHALDMKNVHYLYSLVKDYNPPISTDSYYGNAETAVFVKTVTGNDKTRIIPININMDVWDEVKQTTNKGIDEITPYNTDNKYLSLAWYFKQNGDEHNSAAPADGPNTKRPPDTKDPIVAGGQLPSTDPIQIPPTTIQPAKKKKV